jgi:hypothetical protein
MGVLAFPLAILGDGHDHRLIATATLLLGWPLALLAGVTGRVLARAAFAVDAPASMTGDPSRDLARLEARDPLREACTTAMRWEGLSAGLPLAAVSLLAPLTIHFVVYSLFDLSHFGAKTLEDFGMWAAMSVIIVGHAHLALLVCSLRWAHKLRARPTDEIHLGLSRAWLESLLISAGIACLPGIVLLGIPPILVIVTGLLFVPLMFKAMARWVVEERVALEST